MFLCKICHYCSSRVFNFLRNEFVLLYAIVSLAIERFILSTGAKTWFFPRGWTSKERWRYAISRLYSKFWFMNWYLCIYINKHFFIHIYIHALLGGMRDDDWKCPKCGNVNYSFRTVCNMRKCNTPKPESQVWDTNLWCYAPALL